MAKPRSLPGEWVAWRTGEGGGDLVRNLANQPTAMPHHTIPHHTIPHHPIPSTTPHLGAEGEGQGAGDGQGDGAPGAAAAADGGALAEDGEVGGAGQAEPQAPSTRGAHLVRGGQDVRWPHLHGVQGVLHGTGVPVPGDRGNTGCWSRWLEVELGTWRYRR